MKNHYPALLVVIPLLAAFVTSGLGWFKRRLCFPTAAAGCGLSTLLAAGLFVQVLKAGKIHYRLGGWQGPWGIVYEVDHLNGFVLLVVSVLGLLNLVASRQSIETQFKEKSGAVYALYLLFLTGLAGILVTGDLFNLYVLLEVASLASYALIALGEERAPLASLNYVFIGTIGACFYLLGVGYLYIMTGSLNMADVASLLPAKFGSTAIRVAFLFCMVGVWIKMAFFPLHVWLPNAYTYAPPFVGSLIAPLMTKVMVYVMVRLIFSVFSVEFSFHILDLSIPVVWLASLAIVAGALLALAQRDLKRMLTYVIVSEIGYLVGGVWIGNQSSITGAILHIMNDALMTLCLFLASGIIAGRIGNLKWNRFGGLFRKMPFTMACFTLGGLSIVGVPPTCGFFSKWYLIKGAFEGTHYEFVAALLLSSLISLILFFRIFEQAFFEHHSHVEQDGGHRRLQEAPLGALLPLGIVSSGLIVVSVYTLDVVKLVIEPFLAVAMG